jgi:hypothetical protein
MEHGWAAVEIGDVILGCQKTAPAETECDSSRATLLERSISTINANIFRSVDIALETKLMARTTVAGPRPSWRPSTTSTTVRSFRLDITAWAFNTVAFVGLILAAIPEMTERGPFRLTKVLRCATIITASLRIICETF